MRDRQLAAGVDLFNAREFWHAHEAWEKMWLEATGDEKRFLQGLIQLAAAYHHMQRGTFRGAARLFDAALTKLAAFPDGHLGIDRAEAVRCAREHRAYAKKEEKIKPGEYPNIRYN